MNIGATPQLGAQWDKQNKKVEIYNLYKKYINGREDLLHAKILWDRALSLDEIYKFQTVSHISVH